MKYIRTYEELMAHAVLKHDKELKDKAHADRKERKADSNVVSKEEDDEDIQRIPDEGGEGEIEGPQGEGEIESPEGSTNEELNLNIGAVICSACGAENSIRCEKKEISIDDKQGSYKDLTFDFCEECGNVTNVDLS